MYTFNDGVITGEATSYFGASLVSGDFNADGKTDLAVGAYWYSTQAGRTYIFYNDGSIPTTAATADVIITGEASSYFGISLTSGDFNADGKTDLTVGASGYSTSTGRTYIFYNDGSIPTTAVTADVIITGEAGSYLGYSLNSGDFNADGKTDLAVGAYTYSSNTGRTYIFYNDDSIRPIYKKNGLGIWNRSKTRCTSSASRR
jgi:formylmethanofuran dehydrogenase subunit C